MNASEEFRIAWATPDDAQSLLHLLTELYRHEVPEAPMPTPETAALHANRLLSGQAPHKLALAWSEDARAIGLAAVAYFLSISDPDPERWVQTELKELFVLPEFRGSGLGGLMMQWIEADARRSGACRIDWHVRKDNLRGIAFYERTGAAVVESRISMQKSFL